MSKHAAPHHTRVVQGFVKVGGLVNEDVSSLVLAAKSLFEFSALDIDKQDVPLSTFSPKVRACIVIARRSHVARQVCLVVNVASK